MCLCSLFTYYKILFNLNTVVYIYLMDEMNLCSCCLRSAPDKDLTTPYIHLGKIEIYSNMLKDCFDIQLTLASDSCGTCLVCVGRLQDASDFKLQVQHSQAELQARLNGATIAADVKPTHKVEKDEDDDDNMLFDALRKPVVKLEQVSEYENETVSDTHPVPDFASAMDGDVTDDEASEAGSTDAADAEASPAAVSLCAKEQLALGCSVRLERLRDSPRASQPRPVTSHREPSQPRPVTSHREPSQPCPVTSHREPSQPCPMTSHREPNPARSVKKKLIKKDIPTGSTFDIPITDNSSIVTVVPSGKVKIYSCEICCKDYTTKFNLIRHINTHSIVRSPHTTQVHSTHTTQELYECNICQKKFKYKNNMNVHKRIHLKDKPYECSSCEKRFAQKSYLIAHIRIHTGQKPYKCKICNKAFVESTNLRRHQIVHTGDKRYSCKICETQFTQKSSLLVHLRRHEGYKPFKCDICHKQFVGRSDIVSHLRTHSGYSRPKAPRERNYCCEICGKKFESQYALKRHQTIHMDVKIKPYTCEICKKHMARKYELTAHMKIHEGHIYTCEVCNKSYTSNRALTRHKRDQANKPNTHQI
ncbi:zinc finger and SCAN domain-containing protein 22-like [Cydia strobilella]|uniref:zinc finger and SCAN domain-containing protein 22-like n=1 Tax=Cydia strobilella TaxID=1100964 RepID=UPI003005C8CC